MHIIPVTVLDNFLDDPDKIRAWALQQEYFTSKDGQWPGVRSKPIHELDAPFFHLIVIYLSTALHTLHIVASYN